MKLLSSSLAGRVAAGTPFFIIGLCFAIFALTNLSAGNRFQSATKNSISGPATIALAVPTPFSGTYNPTMFPCSTPKHQFVVPPGQVRIFVQVSAELFTNDITVTLLFGSGA